MFISGRPVDLFEYQGKQFFARYGIPVSAGEAVRTVDDAVAAAERVGYPVVVKAQVQVGGRGKAGGIKLAANADDFRFLQPIIFLQRRFQSIMRQSESRVSVKPFHCFGSYQRVQDRLFGCLDRCLKQQIDLVIWQHGRLCRQAYGCEREPRASG